MGKLLIVGLISFLTLVDLFAAQAILPELVQAYQTTPAMMGVAVNASTIGMAAAGVVVALVPRAQPAPWHLDQSRATGDPDNVTGECSRYPVVHDASHCARVTTMSTAFTLTMAYLTTSNREQTMWQARSPPMSPAM